MEKLKRKDMIERLSRFRACGDQISDDLYNLSLKILNITSELETKSAREEISHDEEAILLKLQELTEQILRSSLNADKYNKSLLKDYSSVIKSLSSESGGVD